MADHVPGEWFLVIDLGTLGLSAEVPVPGQPPMSVMVALPDGVLRIPFATEASAIKALGHMEISIDGPPMVIQGEVITEREAIEKAASDG